jgi:hypothetical protein
MKIGLSRDIYLNNEMLWKLLDQIESEISRIRSVSQWKLIRDREQASEENLY